MDKISWDKKIALEIIQAGYLRVAKRLHPDVGGTHEQLLVLTATKEHLEKAIATGKHDYTGDAFNYQRAREEPRRHRSTYRSHYWDQENKKTESTGEVPLEDYADDLDYVVIREATIMSTTEKAIRIKIPGVKQGQWLPKSQLLAEDFTGWIDGDVITVVLSKWIARQKGWMK